MNSSDDIISTALDALKDYSSENPMPASDLISVIAERLQISKREIYRIYPVIRDRAKEKTALFSSKRGRNGGYFVIAAPENSASETDATPRTKRSGTLEKHFYPLIARWLEDEKEFVYTNYEIANKKVGGKWGNPDVVGLNLVNKLGFFAVDVVTVEVKPTMANWREFIFEAVSHKRFSDRVYFAVRMAGRDSDELPDLTDYCKKFGIGLVASDMSNAQYDQLVHWPSLDEQEKVLLLESLSEVVEAPLDEVSVSLKVKFLQDLGFKERDDLIAEIRKKK